MNTNEKIARAIARWLGKPVHEPPLHKQLPPGNLVFAPPYPGPIAADACICVVVVEDGVASYVPWSPCADIALWHGPGGLLEEIHRRSESFWGRFIECLACECRLTFETISGVRVMPRAGVFIMLHATPAQLSAALEAVINGDE